jgi:hypothetical protein
MLSDIICGKCGKKMGINSLVSRWRYEMRIKKHPQTIAWDKWIESPEGKACSQDLPTAHIYLLNRLVRAFDAGVSWAEKKRDETIT